MSCNPADSRRLARSRVRAGGHRLFLRFADGVEGTVDFTAEVPGFKNLFEPLRDQEYFATVRVDPEWGTVCWPNGLELDPVVLYYDVLGKPVPDAPDEWNLQRAIRRRARAR